MIDCPPNLHLCSWAALVASDFLIVPLQPEDYGAQGIIDVQESIALVAGGPNPGLKLLGYLITMHVGRKSIHKLYEENLRAEYGGQVFSARVPHAAEFPEAIAHRKPVAHYKPRGPPPRRSRPWPTRSWHASPTHGAARRPKGRPPKMSKLDELRRAAGTNVAESMSKDLVRPAATHCASAPAPAGPDRWAGLERLAGAQRIPIGRIERDPGQPREVFDEAELAELAESIRTRGVLQPIRVRWDEGRSMYVVIAGERRLRAAGIAGQADVPCVIHDVPLSEAEILLDQLAENIIRLDLQPIEQARAFRRLMDANGWSARRLAEELHIDHDKVNRAVRLLELPGPVQAAVAGGGPVPDHRLRVIEAPQPGGAGRAGDPCRRRGAVTRRRRSGGASAGRRQGRAEGQGERQGPQGDEPDPEDLGRLQGHG